MARAYPSDRGIGAGCEDAAMTAVSVLSDGTIRRLVAEGRIRIDPWDERMLQPASVDLRLGGSFRVFHNHRIGAIDLADPPRNLTEHVEIGAGESFVIHPGEFVLGRTEEHVALADDLVARIEGKALALDTEVPTPFGWRTMADLRPGDLVFGLEGGPTLVVAATEPMMGRPCAEVVFSDGTTVLADLDHGWMTESEDDRRRGRGPQVRTTAEIGATLRHGAREFNHIVDQALPVRYARRELPIDPYVLGVRIGDGTSTKAEITTADMEVLDEIRATGCAVAPASAPLAYRIGGEGHTRDPRTGRCTRSGSPSGRLRRLGLLGAKRIPEVYLQADVDQRRRLLAGLMDSDGHVDVLGRCDLATIDRALAEQYRELIASLGLKPVVATKTATLYGKVCGLRHEVTFTPDAPVFALSRKLARQERDGRFERGRSIVAIRRIDSVPVRCIQVADPRGVFLVTRSFVPTHNSSLGRLGLIVHATAGFVDPGFRGTLTLEITNLTRVPIILWPGKPIAQLSFMTLDRPAERPYGHPDLGSHYHGQVEATESRYEGGPAT
jgi:deoxycytidine triphosphate deaminase